MRSTRTMAVMMAALILAASAGPALAVDAPKWVAAVYMAPQSAVGLRWNAVPGATGYKVLRSQTKGAGHQEIYSGAQPQFFDKAVEPAETYYYVLQAVDAAGPSANSDEKSVLIPGEKKRALNPPDWDQFGLTETTEFGKTSYKIGLSWKKSENPDVVAYNLLRSTTKGKDYQQIWSGTETKYVDSTGIEEGKTYYYVLTVLDNAFQESKQSPEKEQLVKKAEKKAAVKTAEAKKIVPKATKIVIQIPLEGEPLLTSPIDMVVDKEEGVLYVLETYPPQVVVYDMDGKRTLTFGTIGMSEGQFQSPSGLAVDPDGMVYVTDIARKRVLIFDGKGNFKREFQVTEKAKPDDPKVLLPVGIAIASDGTIYVSDNENGHIVMYDSSGKKLGYFAEPCDQKNKGLGFLSGAALMTTDSQDRVHVADYGPSRTQVFDKTGKPLFTIGEGVKGLVGSFVKVGKPCPDDKNKIIYGLDGAMGNIQAFDWETGEYLFTLVGADKKLKFNERPEWGLTSTRVMAIDKDERLWVLMGVDRKIAVVERIEK